MAQASLDGAIRGTLDVMATEVFDGKTLSITRGFNNTNVLGNFDHAAEVLVGKNLN